MHSPTTHSERQHTVRDRGERKESGSRREREEGRRREKGKREREGDIDIYMQRKRKDKWGIQ